MAQNLTVGVIVQRVALFTLVSFTVMPAMAQTQTWYLDPAHSAAQFSVRHMGISTVRGSFTKVAGTVDDSSDVTKAAVNISIDTASVDTRVDMRNKDLRSDKWFDVAKYPTITFKSTRIEAAGTGKLKVTGDLTMHGVTKQVVLDVDGPSAPFKDPRGTSHRGISATTGLNRSDYGMTSGVGVVGDAIAIQLDVELVDKIPGPPPGGHPPTPPPAM